MTIREYFDAAYLATTTDAAWEAVEREEDSLYDMEDDDQIAWLDAHGIDYTSDAGREALRQWFWDFEY